MKEIAKAIQEGAMAYLKRQFKTILVILVPLAVIVFLTSTKVKTDGLNGVPSHLALSYVKSGIFRTGAFVLGCFMSGLTGFIGMSLAVRGNVRTAAAAEARIDAGRAAGRVPHRWRRRHVHRRPRSARRVADHDRVPEHELGHPRRVRVRWLAARAVPASRRRHLHEGGRRRRRPRRQGRSRYPRRRPAQPGDDRRQRG